MPPDSARTGAGFERVRSSVTCVVTRFQVRSVWQLVSLYRHYRRVRRDARRCAGLLHAAFLVESPRTFYSLTLWTDDGAVLEFGTAVDSHVAVAGRGLSATYRRDLRRPEVWSTQWRLAGTSGNLNWEGVDLRPLVAPQ
ncbi:MAG: hypothetical protein AUI14_24960 [Actinobacteria bacterium 13_2_20CM_2_71_6]|nr:MAG: hypothetical protein AUI14_24960 [Actinobacteria bacterium 13_2_20CM_2_71_6]